MSKNIYVLQQIKNDFLKNNQQATAGNTYYNSRKKTDQAD